MYGEGYSARDAVGVSGTGGDADAESDGDAEGIGVGTGGGLVVGMPVDNTMGAGARPAVGTEVGGFGLADSGNSVGTRSGSWPGVAV